jgi:pyruvate ferredoxin oxidoreductase alpha subunit
LKNVRRKIGILPWALIGTLRDALGEYPDAGPAKLIKLRTFRPFPAEALREACAGLTDLVVLERALSPGSGGIVGTEVRAAFAGTTDIPRVHNFAVGLGGRDIPLDIYPRLMAAVKSPTGESFAVFDAILDKLPEADR